MDLTNLTKVEIESLTAAVKETKQVKRDSTALRYLLAKGLTLSELGDIIYELLAAGKLTDNIRLSIVKHNGYALKYIYITEQTPEICLAAIKQNPWALEYVLEQTPEICLAAVKQDGRTLEYVKEQTPEICLAAVKQNGFALQFVKNLTPAIKAAAEGK